MPSKPSASEIPAPSRLSRRAWLRQSLATATAITSASVLPRPVRARSVGANDDVHIAVAGLHIRGAQLIDAFGAVPGVRITALCDVDREILDKHRQQLSDQGHQVAAVQDFRRLLDRQDIDAIVIATPDHWHALMTVWACEAGKDVYVEKPVSHNIWEGRQMIRAARMHDRIVACGTQNRSDPGFREAAAFLADGGLGSLRHAWILNYVFRESIGRVAGPQPVPATVDYDLFRGPADLVPLRRQNLHYDWHWSWDTGTGECGNRGVHAFDHVRWLIGETGTPTAVRSIGGRFGWDDDGETPNTQVTLFEGLKVPMIYELRNLPSTPGGRQPDRFRDRATTMWIQGDQGHLVGGRGFVQAFRPDGELIRKFDCDGGKGHAANFISAVRNRNRDTLNSELEVGHVSSNYCHLANVSVRCGHLGEEAAAAAPAPEFADAIARMREHLATHRIDPKQHPLTFGPRLSFDPATEQLTGEAADWANMYLRRTYRAPYTLTSQSSS